MWRSLAWVVSRFLRCATERARMSECRRTDRSCENDAHSKHCNNETIDRKTVVGQCRERPTCRCQLGFCGLSMVQETEIRRTGCWLVPKSHTRILDLTMLGVWLAGGLAGYQACACGYVGRSVTYTRTVRASAFILRRLLPSFTPYLSHSIPSSPYFVSGRALEGAVRGCWMFSIPLLILFQFVCISLLTMMMTRGWLGFMMFPDEFSDFFNEKDDDIKTTK
ncbi:hypothetical protein B0T09DRAFT_43327 [Sordaria sp. MPI-SDFR-AT-0083]|nr:hypothetical protein B0T09DRAFT_43327 [Sordaria sp. MPI-SDFR-AT-0083]